MLGTPKPASLSSGLLARKGQARPAMRPQGFVKLTPSNAIEDLGWNDMGHDAAAPEPTDAPPAERPLVLRQRDALDEQFAVFAVQAEPAPPPAAAEAPQAEIEPEPQPEPEPEPAPAAQLPDGTLVRVAREVAAHKSKAAFTLRLDSDRHLRLRLASAVSGQSAQQLVTEALDAFLKTLPEVEELARQLETKPGRG